MQEYHQERSQERFIADSENRSLEVFNDWYGNVIHRYAYFVEHGHSWEFDRKEKKYRWLGKDHPYKGGKTKIKDEEGKGGKSQEEEEEHKEEEEEEETDNEMPPLAPVPGHDDDDDEEESDSEEEYDADQHLWSASSSSWQNPASSSWQQPASSNWQSSTSSSWQDPQRLEGYHWSSQEQQHHDTDDWWKNHPGGGKDDQDGEH